MVAFSFASLVGSALIFQAHGHAATIQPVPRAVNAFYYCPWCVGEHVASNGYGIVNKDARPSQPCSGSKRGDAPYPADRWAEYGFLYPTTEQTYSPGGQFEAIIALNADHNGEAQWQLCPHSEAETEECFRNYRIDDWTDVHAYWDASNQVDQWKSGEYYHQTVRLPSNIPEGAATLRWIWVCKYTDEIFTSCIDVSIGSGGSTPSVPVPSAQPAPAPQPPSVLGGLDSYCYLSQCGCPPFEGKPNWCSADSARVGSAWCQANEAQCGQCGSDWCDVTGLDFELAAMLGPEVQSMQSKGDGSSGSSGKFFLGGAVGMIHSPVVSMIFLFAFLRQGSCEVMRR